MSDENKPAPIRATQWVLRKPTTQRFAVDRAIGFGGAAFCSLYLLSMLSFAPLSSTLQIGAVAAALGVPLWIAFGAGVDIFSGLGRHALPFVSSRSWRVLGYFTTIPASIAPVVMIGAVTFELGNVVGTVFVCASIAACVWASILINDLDAKIELTEQDVPDPE